MSYSAAGAGPATSLGNNAMSAAEAHAYRQKASQVHHGVTAERDKSAIEVAIDMLEEANKRAISLNERLSAIVSRAYGEPPISGQGGALPQVMPSGSLGALRAVIDDIHERMSILEGLVSRLSQIA